MMYGLMALLGAALLGLDQWVKAWTVGHFSAPAAGYTATAATMQQVTATSSHRMPEKLDQAAP